MMLRRTKQHPFKAGRAQAGLTFIELLAALAILAILGTMVTAAMMTGARIMESATTASNASVLEQSIGTALDDVLRYASVETTASTGIVDDPQFDSDSSTDASGAALRSAKIVLQDGRLALSTSGGVQSIPKASGIYTDFVIEDFHLSYDCDTNLFTAEYLLSALDGRYTRTCNYVCRTLVNENQI